MKFLIIIFVFTFFYCVNSKTFELDKKIRPNVPQQIHLSLGKSHSEMTITWTTYAPTKTVVRYGRHKHHLHSKKFGIRTKFIDNGNRTHYIHRVTLTKLKPFTTFYYKCGSWRAMSKKFQFKTMTDDNSADWSPKMIVFGDMGVERGEIIDPYLIDEAKNGTINAVFHNGDFAYDFATNNSFNGDTFMRLIEPIATRVPYQTSIGNHETGDFENYYNYMNRFSMRDMIAEKQIEDNVLYYSFYLGKALIISINNQVYMDKYNQTATPSFMKEQEDWLVELLERANTPEERAAHPWIIVFGHLPFYCHSSPVDTSCTSEPGPIRDGLEDIFYKGGVDLIIGSHIHNYERNFPMYKGEMLVESYETPHTNPKAPVNIVSGAGGADNRELIDFQFFPRPYWNAFGNSQFGYGIIEIVNSTNLIYTQKALITNHTTAYQNNLQIVDQVEIIQEHHGPR